MDRKFRLISLDQEDSKKLAHQTKSEVRGKSNGLVSIKLTCISQCESSLYRRWV